MSHPFLRRLPWLLLWAVLTANFFYPARAVLDRSLDYSNYASYAYFTAHGFHYGSEVVPMCGPYGFVLYGFVHGGDLFWTRHFAELAVKGLFAALALWACLRARGAPVARWVWLASLVLFMGGIEDYPFDWLILLGGMWIIFHDSPAGRFRWALPMAAVLGWVALGKGTHLVLTFATVGVGLLPALARREWRRAILLGGVFVLSLVASWLLAGQRLGDLPAFGRGILELSSGYNAAMQLDETMPEFYRGAGLALLLAAIFLTIAWRRRREPAVLAAMLLLAGFVAVEWKHGFVRADGHIFIFYSFAAGLATTWIVCLGIFAPDPAPRRRWAPGVLAAGAILLALFGLGSGDLGQARWIYQKYPARVRANLAALRDPRDMKARLDAELAASRQRHRLSAFAAVVGRAKVDVFGYEFGSALLNDFNYSPRPVGGGSFSTFTAGLMELNDAFMRDPARRPDYFLLKYQTVDNRLAAQDDALTFRRLLEFYTPHSMEQGYLLLEAAPAAPDAPPLQPAGTRTFGWNDNIEVPAVPPDQMLFASFVIHPSWWGRLRAALYKPPLIFISQTGHELVEPESRRLVPAMAEVPFPFSPAIETNRDVVGLYGRKPGKALDHFRLATDHPAAFDSRLQVNFYTRPRPQPPTRVDVEEITAFLDSPLANPAPDTITPATEPVRILDDRPVQMLRPPAQLSWKLGGNEREFLFDYGFAPEAYRQGQSNGAVFVVELQAPNQPVEPLFRATLDPRTEEGRLVHSARVVLPFVRDGTRLVLRTEPGEFNDSAWDWTFVTRMHLKHGLYSPRQFPGFNRPPDEGDIERTSLVDLPEGRRVVQLHAPGRLLFRLRGDETHLAFDYGFHPRAYAEGTTDGAIVTVEIAHPNRPRQLLLRRPLEPRTRETDRGRQHADFALPVLGPAASLVVTIDPGPAGNNAWDWTYLSDFTLE